MATRKARKEADPELSGVDILRQEIQIAASAACGVTFIRTREPFDARVAVEEDCLQNKMALRVWNNIRGWQTVDLESGNMSITAMDEMTSDLIPALKKLFDVACPRPDATATAQQAQQQDIPTRGMFLMMWPDPFMEMPKARAYLAELAAELPYGRQRLFLIVPPSFDCPPELSELVPIIDFALPTAAELRTIYNAARRDAQPEQKKKSDGFSEDEVTAVCSAGAGMTRREFMAAVCSAYSSMEIRGLTGAETFRKLVLDKKTEVVKRSEVLEILKPASMDEIGGLENLKNWVAKRRICFTEEAKAAGVDQPKGLGLIGPPGTGKSAVAKAIAAVLQVPCVRFDLSRVFGSLVGQSEARVSTALDMIDAMAPCVVFVDEIDKVFNINSGGGDGGTSSRVLGKVLTHMQESEKPIFWVLTANRTDNLPPELLRKGRLDEIFSVSTPQEEERAEIFAIHLRKRGVDPEKLDLQKAVDASNGYVGGEIEAACKEAILEAFNDGMTITVGHIVAALKNMKPLSMSFKDDFAAMALWAEKHCRPASGVDRQRGSLAAVAGGDPARVRSRGRDRRPVLGDDGMGG